MLRLHWICAHKHYFFRDIFYCSSLYEDLPIVVAMKQTDTISLILFVHFVQEVHGTDSWAC